MLRAILVGLQVLISLCIIALVLLQRGKGADAGAGFGAGASGTVFGARGARTALSRATAVLAALFMVNSLALTFLATRPSAPQRSILDEATDAARPARPATGAAAPAAPPPAAPSAGAPPAPSLPPK